MTYLQLRRRKVLEPLANSPGAPSKILPHRSPLELLANIHLPSRIRRLPRLLQQRPLLELLHLSLGLLLGRQRPLLLLLLRPLLLLLGPRLVPRLGLGLLVHLALLRRRELLLPRGLPGDLLLRLHGVHLGRAAGPRGRAERPGMGRGGQDGGPGGDEGA